MVMVMFKWKFKSKALKDRQRVFIEMLGQLKTRAVFVSSECKCWCHSTELQVLGKRCSLLFISLYKRQINLNFHELYFMTVFKDICINIKKPSEYMLKYDMKLFPNIWLPRKMYKSRKHTLNKLWGFLTEMSDPLVLAAKLVTRWYTLSLANIANTK